MSSPFIEIDGRMGEGGGQVLRASLALSLATGQPMHVVNIRGTRPKPGLRRQHLACVKAAGEISGAEVSGAEINSREIFFSPGPARGGDYQFNIGGGGSCTLLLQAVLPPLMMASEKSRIIVSGGTHVPLAPVYEFFEKTLKPQMEKLGPNISCRLIRTGFMHAGGGSIEVEIEPKALKNIDLIEAGELVNLSCLVQSYGLEESIAEREAMEIRQLDGLNELEIEHLSPEESGFGNVLLLTLEQTSGRTIVSGLGRLGLAAEKVARQAVSRLKAFKKARVPVDVYLADQLIVPMALAGGGRFLTEKPSPHTLTVMELLPKFLKMKARRTEVRSGAWLIEIS